MLFTAAPFPFVTARRETFTWERVYASRVRKKLGLKSFSRHLKYNGIFGHRDAGKALLFFYGKTVNVTSLVEAFSVEMKVNKKAK